MRLKVKIKWVNCNYKNKYIYLERRGGKKKDRFGWNVKSYPLFSKANWYVFRTEWKNTMITGRYGAERDMKSLVQVKLFTI